MLGYSLLPIIKANFNYLLATDIKPNTVSLEKLDVRDVDECEKVIASFAPDVVIHLVALTDLEYCEKNPKDATLQIRQAQKIWQYSLKI